MKKIINILVFAISFLSLSIPKVYAQSLPSPDLSVWNSSQMQPVRDFANIAIGVIFGIAVLYSVIMVAWHGIKLQSAGADNSKSQAAKNGLKSTIVGVGITFAAVFIIGIILYILGIIGIKTS